MSARPSPAAVRARRSGRSGVTLVEVLMSVLVMGIGVVSVATLFPLAVLRGARATQLTAATIAKQNAEQTIRFARTPPLTVPLPATMGGVPVEAAGGGDPNRVDVTTFRPTLGDYPVTGVPSAAMLFDPDANGIPLSIRGGIGPAAVVLAAGDGWGPAVGGTGLPRAFSAMTAAARPSGRKFVVDPLGAATLAGLGTAATPWQYGAVDTGTGELIDQFGNALTPAAGFSGPVLRFAWPFPWEVIQAANAGGAYALPDGSTMNVRDQMIETAYEIVGRQGDYGTDLDAVADVTSAGGVLTVAFDPDEVTPGSLEEFFPQTRDDGGGRPTFGTGPAERAVPLGSLGRAVLFTENGRDGAAVPLARLWQNAGPVDVIDGTTVRLALPEAEWINRAGPLGAGGVPSKLRVRLERPDRRYSWMLTAYQEQGRILRAHVVVYFNRALSAADEKVFRCHPLVVRTAGGAELDSLVIFHDSATVPPVSGGTRLLDVGSMQWIETSRAVAEDLPLASAPQAIQDYANGLDDVPAAADRYTRFVPDEQARVRLRGGADVFLTAPAGIVDVYEINPPREEIR